MSTKQKFEYVVIGMIVVTTFIFLNEVSLRMKRNGIDIFQVLDSVTEKAETE